MFDEVPATWYALNVGWMTWSRPQDGVPFWALTSQPLTAFGLPVDSRMMLRCRPSYEPGMPLARMMSRAWLIQPSRLLAYTGVRASERLAACGAVRSAATAFALTLAAA